MGIKLVKDLSGEEFLHRMSKYFSTEEIVKIFTFVERNRIWTDENIVVCYFKEDSTFAIIAPDSYTEILGK